MRFPLVRKISNDRKLRENFLMLSSPQSTTTFIFTRIVFKNLFLFWESLNLTMASLFFADVNVGERNLFQAGIFDRKKFHKHLMLMQKKKFYHHLSMLSQLWNIIYKPIKLLLFGSRGRKQKKKVLRGGLRPGGYVSKWNVLINVCFPFVRQNYFTLNLRIFMKISI
mgnify:CR=1 FL=1